MNTKAGERLWETDHQGKESKLGTDTKSMREAAQFAFLQSYAPYVQQVVNVGLATLPDGPRAAAAPAQTGCLMPGGTK